MVAFPHHVITIKYKMKKEIGEDVKIMYGPYKNTTTVWKQTVISEYSLVLPERYEPFKIMGKGSYGVVVAAKDHKVNGELVAIKKMNNVFEHKTFARRTLRQLRLLRLIQHENVVAIKTIILPKSREQFEDLYVVFEIMDTDLTTILRGEEKLTKDHHKFFMYQILRGLKYIHSTNIAHRDLKPRNILLDANCDLKICDFGLSRLLVKEITAQEFTDYVTTRWYRPPELLLGQTQYTTAVDMWSLGCIFAQILFKKPILTANSTRDQITIICECLGMPDLSAMPHITEESKIFIKKICYKNKKPPTFAKMTQKITPQEKQLLSKLLVFEPGKRISAKQALKLPYFEKLHLEEDEPEGQPINNRQFEFEDHNLTTQQLKDLLYQEILLYHFPKFEKTYYEKREKGESLISNILQNSNSTNIDPEADDDGEQ